MYNRIMKTRYNVQRECYIQERSRTTFKGKRGKGKSLDDNWDKRVVEWIRRIENGEKQGGRIVRRNDRLVWEGTCDGYVM